MAERVRPTPGRRAALAIGAAMMATAIAAIAACGETDPVPEETAAP